jgi:hypothetical protein
MPIFQIRHAENQGIPGSGSVLPLPSGSCYPETMADQRETPTDPIRTLLEKEMFLLNNQRDLALMNHRYFVRLGGRYLLLDELHAQITALLAVQNPGNTAALREAERTSQRARETAEQIASERAGPVPRETEYSDTIQQRFQDLLRELHPALASDELERERRTERFEVAREVYLSGNLAQLESFLDNTPTKEIRGGDPDRQTLQQRLEEIDQSLEELLTSELYTLKQCWDQDLREGHDLLDALAKRMDEEIQRASQLLQQLATTEEEEDTAAP